jgi:hypothetical protein
MHQAKVISSSMMIRGALLDAGAAVARGDIMLFLWPDSQLPPDALQAIEHNLRLLPQTIGGNFHVKFNDDSHFTRLLTRILKRWRYKGHYYGHSGVFVRKNVYEALGGFQPYHILEDYDFTQRMEKYGPTLYLPETIIASAHKFRNQKFKATLIWLTIQSLFALGLHPNKLTWLRAKLLSKLC